MNYFLQDINYFKYLPIELINKITSMIFVKKPFTNELINEQIKYHYRFIYDRLRITVNQYKQYRDSVNNTIHYNTYSRLKFNMSLIEENFYKRFKLYPDNDSENDLDNYSEYDSE